MPNKVKHLRASADLWAQNDAVIDDGELALLKTESGRYRMKIGNGEQKFSELELFGGEVYYTSNEEIVLKHCADVRLGEIESVTVSFPSVLDDDYYALLTFDTPMYGAEVIIDPPCKMRFTGSSIAADNSFAPLPDMHYTLIIWYDGELQCHVRGISNAQ